LLVKLLRNDRSNSNQTNYPARHCEEPRTGDEAMTRHRVRFYQAAQGGFSKWRSTAAPIGCPKKREREMMRPGQSSFHTLRGVAFAALIVTTVALGSLRDVLVFAPNGAEVDSRDPGTTATVPKQR
jgi:hypothetical protein